MNFNEFQQTIWSYYNKNKREFSWRQTTDPYCILVSEIMLQQTQTFRVEPKYALFIEELPTFKALAYVPFPYVLQLWKGLGYNRRALALQHCAKKVINEFSGKLPDDPKVLQTFPGIGYATSCSIAAFAFNKPSIFIETNIRSVYIHFFFKHRGDVTDKEIMPLVAATIDKENPREWYYALMDYGVLLKKHYKEINTRSKHYTKQSHFEGSDRQIRGKILECLLQYSTVQFEELHNTIAVDSTRLYRIVETLKNDQLIIEKNNKLMLIK